MATVREYWYRFWLLTREEIETTFDLCSLFLEEQFKTCVKIAAESHKVRRGNRKLSLVGPNPPTVRYFRAYTSWLIRRSSELVSDQSGSYCFTLKWPEPC